MDERLHVHQRLCLRRAPQEFVRLSVEAARVRNLEDRNRSGVVATRADVHYVVTEYGVADLFGKSPRERAEALTAIAHPDFREELRAAARRRKLL